MIRLRYPVGLGLAAAALVGFAIALFASAAEGLTRANGAVVGPSTGQPSEDDFLAYYLDINLQYSFLQLVPWIVFAATLTAIGALMLIVLRSRQASSGVPRG